MLSIIVHIICSSAFRSLNNWVNVIKIPPAVIYIYIKLLKCPVGNTG